MESELCKELNSMFPDTLTCRFWCSKIYCTEYRSRNIECNVKYIIKRGKENDIKIVVIKHKREKVSILVVKILINKD